MNGPLRVRYAPSPTGHLHIGGARTALFDYLTARKSGGAFVVRFEDTDQTRHVESGIQNQLDGLRWLGLAWDESVDIGGPYAPYRQMERLELYKPYTEQLLASGAAYRCYMSEEELEQERAEQEARGEITGYSGQHRNLSAEQIAAYEAEGRIPAIRFRVPENRVIALEDRVRGLVEFDSNGIADFIIVRPDGIPTYNFAVILDDHLMKIDLIIRGEEHLTNTPKQIMLYQALGLPVPQFAHLSLVLNKDRKKMSKRDESVLQFTQQYQELGYLPEAVLNFLALLGWSPVGEEEMFTLEELIEQFDFDRVSKSPAVFDTDKLNWMSNQYMKKADPARVAELAIPHLQRAGRLPQELTAEDRQWATRLVALYQEQMSCAADIVGLTELFFRDELELDEECRSLLAEDYATPVLQSLLAKAKQNEDFTPEGVKAMIKQVQAETGYKGKPLFMTSRVALTGQVHGRDLNDTISLIGKQKVVARLESLLS